MRVIPRNAEQEAVDDNVKNSRLFHAGIGYTLNQLLGKGAFSAVFQAEDDWGNSLAIKRFYADGDLASWKNEVANLARFRHPRIVFLHAAFEQDSRRYIVLEKWGVPIDTIQLDAAADRAVLSRLVARHLLEALHFIHRAGYLHGDIRPSNVLVALSKTNGFAGVKLCDFGFTQAAQATIKNWPVALWNPPPERYDPLVFGLVGPPSDIYHAALVILRVLLGELPVFSQDEIVGGAPQRLARGIGTPFGEALAQALAPASPSRPAALPLWRLLKAAR